MKKIAFCLVLLSQLIHVQLWADLVPSHKETVIERSLERPVYVELLNGDAFPNHRFYIQYQAYDYNTDQFLDTLTRVFLQAGKPALAGDRGAASLLYGDDGKQACQSRLTVGGEQLVMDEAVAYVLERIQITEIVDGEIVLEVVERRHIGDDGQVIEAFKKGAVATGGDNDLLIAMLPVACMLGLLVFFLWRRKASPVA
jgi:hypothetical protein